MSAPRELEAWSPQCLYSKWADLHPDMGWARDVDQVYALYGSADKAKDACASCQAVSDKGPGHCPFGFDVTKPPVLRVRIVEEKPCG